MSNPTPDLTEIPLFDARETGMHSVPTQHLAGAERLIKAGKKMMTSPVVSLFDRRSERWARKVGNPYLDEIESVAAGLPRGAWFMNFCYEWGCTTGVYDDQNGGVTMQRTLDWPFHGLGREIVVMRQSGPKGDFYNITWPGFVGVITGMAPGRFAIAINQAPLRSRGPWPVFVDWILDRLAVNKRVALPPAHLTRQVFEECRTFDEAVEKLLSTPTAVPAFFSVSGTKPGEACIIEHLGDSATRHDGPEGVANDWLSDGLSGKPRGKENAKRRADMVQSFDHAGADHTALDWVTPPIWNKDTRLAAVMNAATETLVVRGYEVDGPATQTFDLSAASPAE